MVELENVLYNVHTNESHSPIDDGALHEISSSSILNIHEFKAMKIKFPGGVTMSLNFFYFMI